jgi:hypothetical protein
MKKNSLTFSLPAIVFALAAQRGGWVRADRFPQNIRGTHTHRFSAKYAQGVLRGQSATIFLGGGCRRRRRPSAYQSRVSTHIGLMLSRRVRHSIGAEHLVPEEMYYSKIAIRVTVMNKV